MTVFASGEDTHKPSITKASSLGARSLDRANSQFFLLRSRDREAAKERRGLGLISMEERLKLVKGTLSISSQAKRGTTIDARVPLNSGSDSMGAERSH